MRCKGFDATAIAQAMIAKNWINRGEGKHLALRVRVPKEGSPRAFHITSGFLDGDETPAPAPKALF